MFKPSLEVLEDRTMPSSNPVPVNPVPVNPGQIVAQVNVAVSDFITRSLAITSQAVSLYRDVTVNIARQVTATISTIEGQDFLTIDIERTRDVTRTFDSTH